MLKYLSHLKADIRHSIELAPVPAELDWEAPGEDDDFSIGPAAQTTHLPSLLGLPAESFPPSTFLSDEQLESLLPDIEALWKSWHLFWDMPLNLTIRQQYDAMLHAMQTEEITWHYLRGGVVKICQYGTGSYCPFGKGGQCYCRVVNEAAKYDIEVWEEHVRSQGLDPYGDLTEEAGAAFEAERQKRELRKRNEEEWPQLDLLDFQVEDRDLDKWPTENKAETADDWLEQFILENNFYPNPPDAEDDDDELDGFFEDDSFDLPQR